MNGKKWLKIWISTISFIPIVGFFNYIIDPMWLFEHSNKFNNMQNGFDEKKIKSIYLKYNKYFDSLLIGSSRTTYYDQNEFRNMNVFNYAFSAGKPYEYIDFIENFKTYSNMNNIIIGFDFIDSLNEIGENRYKKVKENKKIIDDINSLNRVEYFIKNYLTIDIFKYSVENLKRYIFNKTDHRSYNRKNVVLVDKVNENKVVALARKRSKSYYKNVKSYDNEFVKTILKIKNDNINSKIFIYTTPLSKPFLEFIYNDEKLRVYYYQWISDLVSSFGEIYFTTYYNDLAVNYKIHSKDGDHFYPYVGKEITQYISGGNLDLSDINISKNIMIINKKNINYYIALIENKVKILD